MFITDNIYDKTKMARIELNTQKSIRKLISKVNNLEKIDTTLINNVNNLSNSATSLFQKIVNDPDFGMPIDTSFIISLDQSQKKLDQLVVENWSSNEEVGNIIRSIKTDYDIKINSSPLGASSKIITNVEVSVLTRSNNHNVDGYDVYYTYMWDSKEKKDKKSFNNQTNNAIRIISPGYYLFWIEKKGKIIQSKSKVEIGNLMEPKEVIVFNI